MSELDLLMIPGPIELEPAVSRALSQKTISHLDPAFIETFGAVLAQLRQIFGAPLGVPFVAAGGGTLAMEVACANVAQPGDSVLVINTGYFCDRIAKVLERLGVSVEHLRAAVGEAPEPAQLRQALESGAYKAVTITHVDTSTGVRAPVREYAAIAHEAGALVIVDGVCSVGGEEFHQASWGVDVAFTASQKALGAPPGLAVACFGPKAIAARRALKRAPASLYLDLEEWLPIFEAYEARKSSYFATPAVKLITALAASTALLLLEGMSARAARHRWIAHAFRAGWQALGLHTLPIEPTHMAHTLSAIYYPKGIDASLVAAVREEGVVVAAGLHPDLKATYFRVGHMGRIRPSDVLATLGAIERAMVRLGASVELGAATSSAQRVLAGRMPHAD